MLMRLPYVVFKIQRLGLRCYYWIDQGYRQSFNIRPAEPICFNVTEKRIYIYSFFLRRVCSFSLAQGVFVLFSLILSAINQEKFYFFEEQILALRSQDVYIVLGVVKST